MKKTIVFLFALMVLTSGYSQLDPKKYPPTRETLKYFAPHEPAASWVKTFWKWVDGLFGY